MLTCVAVILDCPNCVMDAVAPGSRHIDSDHTCDELCDISGEMKRTSTKYHKIHHELIRCGNEVCRAVLDDHRGNDRMVQRTCAAGYCSVLACPECDTEWASSGPVGCPTCSPVSWHTRVVLRLHNAYITLSLALEHRRQTLLNAIKRRR